MLSTRLVTGITLAIVAIAIIWLDEFFAPWYPLWCVTVLVALAMASREMVRLLTASVGPPSASSVIGGSLAIGLANWWPHIVAIASGLPMGEPNAIKYDPMAPVNALAWPLWAYVAVVMATFLSLSLQFHTGGKTMVTLSATLLAITYVSLLGCFLIQHRWLDGSHHGVIPLLLVLTTTKLSDTGAYTFGRLFGKRKLWPALSPNKTVEGALGGLLFAVLAAYLVVAFARFGLRSSVLNWNMTLGYGLLVGAAAQLGDLMESMIKRDSEAKDADSTVPGFGGLLDVLDSLLFSGPVSYGFLLLYGN